MVAVSSIIAGIGLALTVVGTIKQQSAARKAGKRQDEANRLTREAEKKQQQINDLQTLRAKRAAAREAQIRRANVISGATVAGAAAAGGSTVPGATGSITSQLTTNLSFLDRASHLNTQTVALLGQASELRSQATPTTGAAIANLGGTIFANSEKIGSFFPSGGGGSAPLVGTFAAGHT